MIGDDPGKHLNPTDLERMMGYMEAMPMLEGPHHLHDKAISIAISTGLVCQTHDQYGTWLKRTAAGDQWMVERDRFNAQRAEEIRRQLEAAGIKVVNWPRKETTADTNKAWGTW